MKTNEYLLEPFLRQYFLLEAICGGFMTEKAKKKMYYELASVFCIADGDELEAYYTESNREHFKSVTDTESYERLCRTIEFAQRCGSSIDLTERDRMILAQKREAMIAKYELFKQAKNFTKETAVSALLTMARCGSIDAMISLSYMEYHGICVGKDTLGAIKRMRLCAKWNNLFGNLMGIAYDSENAQTYFDRLYTILKTPDQRQVFDHICHSRGFTGTCHKNAVARIIEKAFGLVIIKRSLYDQVFAKVAFSGLISAEDKRKLLLNKQRDAILSLSDIPFDITDADDIEFDESVTVGLPLDRGDEVRKIAQNLTIAKRCPAEAYTPLLIVSPEEYIMQMYQSMLRRSLGNSACVEIDAGSLSMQDFAGCRDNAFLRGLCETKASRTVFIIRHCEDIEGEMLEELLNVLDCEYRRSYRLYQPPVSLDLSGLVFILLASERTQGVMKLAECCDTVWARRIEADERLAVIDSVFDSRKRTFGVPEVSLEKGCVEFLAGFDTHQAQQLIDSALKRAIFDKCESISLDTFKAIHKELGVTTPRRGFGYVGGEHNAKN